MNDWETIVGIPSTIFVIVIGILGYRASKKKDEHSSLIMTASEERAGVSQRLEILEAVINTLQEERTDLRDRVKELSTRLIEALNDTTEIRKELNVCGEHLAAITKEHELALGEIKRLKLLYEPM